MMCLPHPAKSDTTWLKTLCTPTGGLRTADLISFFDKIRRTDDQIAIQQENIAIINVVGDYNKNTNTRKFCTQIKTVSRKQTLQYPKRREP